MKKSRKVNERYYYILSLLSLAIFVFLWALLDNSEGSVIPNPIEVLRRFILVIREPVAKTGLLMHIWASLRRVLIAFVFASASGIVVGILIGWFPNSIGAVLNPVFNFLRPIPPIAWIPLVILAFGIAEVPKIVIVFIGAFFPVALNTISGLQMVDPLLLSAGRVLGANKRQLLFSVALPDSIPSILAGMKSALSSGWMCVVAAEMIVAKQGVGFLINNGMEYNDPALVMVSMVVIGIVSAIITFVLTRLERILTPWQNQKSK